MSVISVTVHPVADLHALTRAIYSSGFGVSEFRDAVVSGRPVYEVDLFGGRAFHEVAEELVTLVKVLESCGANFVICEDGHEITHGTLVNILTEGRQRYRPR